MEPFVDEIREELESFEVGEEVQLFTLDATPFGGGVYAFSPAPVSAADGSQVQPTFGGQSYTVLPFESEGWEYSAGGPLPRPTVRFKIAREDGDNLLKRLIFPSRVDGSSSDPEGTPPWMKTGLMSASELSRL